MSAKQFPGIIVGRDPKLGYLTYRSQQFVALAAPTRSGKGVGIVIPNLLTYPDSVVVLDLKLENFKYTSLFRQRHGQEVYLFAPFSEAGHTHRWNVFDPIKTRPVRFRVGEVRSIGQSFYPGRVDPKTKFWNDGARNLFVGLALYLLETPELPCTLGEILRQSSGKGHPIKDHIKNILNTRSTSGNLPALSEPCRNALQRFVDQTDNVIGNIVSTFTTPLQIFDDPVVDAATSASDFDFDNVRKKRMSIYFGIQPDMLEDAPELINLFFSQLIKRNLREQAADNPELKYQCLLVLDEFAAIGRVSIIASACGFIASYNLRLLTIFQSLSQLEDPLLYGKHGTRSLLTNHGMQILYPPREQDDAEAYEKTLGYFTAVSKSKGRSRGVRQSSHSENVSEQRRALMLAQELKELDKTKEIITLENCKPILCEKAFFYKDPLFIDRLKPLSPTLAALEQRVPSQEQWEEAALVRGELSIDVPHVDIEAFFNATTAVTANATDNIRPVQEDEMAFLQAADIANQDEIIQALCQRLPTFNEVMAIVHSKEGIDT